MRRNICRGCWPTWRIARRSFQGELNEYVRSHGVFVREYEEECDARRRRYEGRLNVYVEGINVFENSLEKRTRDVEAVQRIIADKREAMEREVAKAKARAERETVGASASGGGVGGNSRRPLTIGPFA